MQRFNRLTLVGFGLGLMLSCKTRVNDSGALSSDTPNTTSRTGDPTMCVGLRGDGQKIMTLIMGVARQTELFGAPEGIVGGSSGSITAFFYESVVTNPLIQQSCGQQGCDTDQANMRVALLMKSLVGYFNDAADHSSARVFRTILNVPEFKDENGEVQSEGWLQRKFDALGDDFTAKKRKADEVFRIVKQTLDNSDLRDLIDPFLLDELNRALVSGNVAKVKTTLRIIQSAVKGLGNVTAGNTDLFLRPRVLSFPNLAKRLGIVADFYAAAGYENDAAYKSGMNNFLNACAKADVSYDKDWSTIAQTKIDGQKTCSDLFNVWLHAHAKNGAEKGIRVNETIGGRKRFDGKRQRAIAVTGVIVDTPTPHPNAVEKWEKAKELYLLSGKSHALTDWNKVGFGYFGAVEDLTTITQSKDRYFAQVSNGVEDAKMERFVPIGASTWLEILSFSSAEPGSSPVSTIPHLSNDGRVIASAGGWSDHFHSQVMRGMGCDMVSFISQPDADAFSTKMAKLLGIDGVADSYDRLFNPEAKDSAFNRSFRYADTTLCHDWDDPKYNGSMESLIQMAGDYYHGALTIITDPRLYPPEQSAEVEYRKKFIEQKLNRYKDLTGKIYPQLNEPQLGCGYRF